MPPRQKRGFFNFMEKTLPTDVNINNGLDIYDGYIWVLGRLFPNLLDVKGVMDDPIKRLREEVFVLSQLPNFLLSLGVPESLISKLPWEKIARWAKKISANLNPAKEMEKLLRELSQNPDYISYLDLLSRGIVSSEPSQSDGLTDSLPAEKGNMLGGTTQNPPWSRVNRSLAIKQPPGYFSRRGPIHRGPGRYRQRKT